MKKLGIYLRLLGAYFATNVSAVLEYRLNFLLQFLGMIINNGAFILFWKFLFDQTGRLSGYAFTDVLFLWALSASSFGFGFSVWGNARHLTALIRNADLDVYLLQPKSPFLSILSAKTEVGAWGDLVFGYIILVLTGADPLRWVVFSLFVISGGVIFASVFALVESLTFFIGSSEGLSRAVQELLLTFSLYPETIFGTGFRWLFYSLIPAGFIAFLPLSVYKALDWPLVPVVFAAAAVYAALAWSVFRIGVRRYESGNGMSLRE